MASSRDILSTEIARSTLADSYKGIRRKKLL